MATALERLYKILAETTVELRKGEELEGTPELVEAVKNLKPGDTTDKLPGGVLEIYAMPHESEARADLERVDVEFITIGVDRKKAEQHRDELVAIIPEVLAADMLKSGPSYIAVGAELGSQSAAFQLFAVGQVLGLWKIITPKLLGATGQQAREMAGMGFIMIDGFRPERLAA